MNGRTGEDRPGAFRLSGIRSVYASPVGAADCVYITDLDVTTLVIGHGDIPRASALNQLDGSFCASATIVEGEIFRRGEQYPYCLVR